MKILIIKYILTLLCSFLIGYEREVNHKGLGIRSSILLCLAFTSVFIVNQELILMHDGLNPARLYSYCLASLSFLGAGLIVKTKDSITGLTTAVCLYLLLSICMLISVQRYALALVITLVSYTILKLGYLEKKGV
jgi:putative Mg2+ transporter-C (MgtC) family protein